LGATAQSNGAKATRVVLQVQDLYRHGCGPQSTVVAAHECTMPPVMSVAGVHGERVDPHGIVSRSAGLERIEGRCAASGIATLLRTIIT
jgi:hypothetical protein